MALTRVTPEMLNSTSEYFTTPMLLMHQGATSANVDVGVLFNRANGLVSNVAIYWSESAQSFVTAFTNNSGATASNLAISSYANLTIGNLLMVNGGILNVTGNITANLVGTVYGNVSTLGNISSGNILATGFFYSNGQPFVSSNYGNANVAVYLPTDPTIVGINANVAGANAAIVTANTAVVSYVNTLNTAMASNVAGANAAIVTANAALKAYVDAANTIQSGQITTLQGQVYANANVASYLLSYSGNIAAGNLTVTGNITTINYDTILYTETANVLIANVLTVSGVNIVANVTSLQSQITGANAAIVTANTAVVSYINSQITTDATNWQANINAANAAIVTANTALKAYVDAANTIQSGQIVTLQGQVYANANVASYLTTYSGNITAANIYANTAGTTTTVANLVTASGVFWPNGSPYSSGSGGSSSNSINPALYLGKVTANTTLTLIDTLPVTGNTRVSWRTTSYDSVNTQYRVSTIDSLNNGSSVFYNEYGVVLSNVGTTVATFTSNISGGNINLYATGNSASVAVTFERLVLGSASTTGYLNVGPAGTVANISSSSGNVTITGNLYVTSNATSGTTTRVEYNIPHPFMLMGAS